MKEIRFIFFTSLLLTACTQHVPVNHQQSDVSDLSYVASGGYYPEPAKAYKPNR